MALAHVALAVVFRRQLDKGVGAAGPLGAIEIVTTADLEMVEAAAAVDLAGGKAVEHPHLEAGDKVGHHVAGHEHRVGAPGLDLGDAVQTQLVVTAIATSCTIFLRFAPRLL